MAPYEALYGRRCRSPIGLFETGEDSLLGIDLVQDALEKEKVKVIEERLRTTQSRQKSYADRKVRDASYMNGEKIFYIKERNLCRKYIGASSVVLVEDSDSCSNGENESSMENEAVVVPLRRMYSCRGRKLSSVVTRICKSLSWEVAKEIPFRKTMRKYGFSRSKAGFGLYKIFHLSTLHTPYSATTSVFVADVLIKVFAANKMLDCAIDVVKQARKFGHQPSIYSCNFLLKCLAEASMKEHLLNLFEKMKSFGPLPNVRTYTIPINFYCKIYQGIEEAEKILEEMQKRQISPSAVTYGTYIDGLCRVGEADFALDFIRDLRDNNKPLNFTATMLLFADFVLQLK
ncbi:pentatricopeptide repeat-containing protein At1g09820 [Nicotiana sylvestris]|uniref:pentatricopeptide repeat-containing protein At1g09820 n=1 Tax=Nicotiana sylvestris TaxID=4096 RepID=UPI00388C7940